MDFWTEVIYNAVKVLATRVWLLKDFLDWDGEVSLERS